MIIKSHIRGGFTAMAQYLKAQGQNEKVRIVELNDGAQTLDEAFHKMWEVDTSRAKKPIHHVSINPMKDERLTDKQVLAIVERLEQKYGYEKDKHQRVIVEHVKDGRQHFHVVWNRVNKQTQKAVWPCYHIKRSKEAAREMEKELGLKSPTSRRSHLKKPRPRKKTRRTYKNKRAFTRRVYTPVLRTKMRQLPKPILRSGTRSSARFSGRYAAPAPYRPAKSFFPTIRRKRPWRFENTPDSEKLSFRRPEWELAELLAWAWETKNYEVLRSFGIHIESDAFEP